VAPPAARDGRSLKPIIGTSFAHTLADAAAPSRHREQYYEMMGHRGYYRDGWEALTLHQAGTRFSEDHWELYDTQRDPTQTTDLADREAERVGELKEAWERAAWENQVFPLDEAFGLRQRLRPPSDAVFGEPVTLVPGTPTLEHHRAMKLIEQR